MKGLFFAHIQQDKQDPTGSRFGIRIGVVRDQLGADHFRLEFQGAKYSFSNVLSAKALESFAFFNSEEARDAFVDGLVNRPPAGNLPLTQIIDGTPPPPAEAP